MKSSCTNRFALSLWIVVLTAASLFSWAQEKSNEKEVGSAQEVVTLRDKVGQISTSSELKSNYDLSLLEPRAYIDLNYTIIEVTKTTSEIDSGGSIRALNGFAAQMVWGGGSNLKGLSFQISITPRIIEGKGVELSIDHLNPVTKMRSQAKILVGNAESAMYQLMENKSKDSKLMLKLIPMVNNMPALEPYTEEVRKLNLEESILTINDDAVIAKGSLRAESDKNEIYLYFFVRGKGLYLVSFKPFENAEKKGVVSGNVLRLKWENDYFEWSCRDLILGKGKWPVWVRNNPKYEPPNEGKIGATLSSKNGYAGIMTGTETVLKIFFGIKKDS
jgi:hypothetical protein